jgi:hypothetical protein
MLLVCCMLLGSGDVIATRKAASMEECLKQVRFDGINTYAQRDRESERGLLFTLDSFVQS